MTEKIVNAITEYEPIAGALASVEKYRGLVFDVTTQQGMKEAKAAQREVAAPRIALEKTRTKLKADVLERGRLIDGEAKRIGALFAAIEDPIKAQIEAEERREQEAREAAIRAEQERLAAEERARKEAEEKRIAEERAKNEAEARRLTDERAKLEAEQRAAREKAEAEDRARRAKIEEEERAAKKRIEAVEAEARDKRQAEEDRLRAEREQLEAARRAKEEEERKARLAEEERQREAMARAEVGDDVFGDDPTVNRLQARAAVERERKRKEAELLDARGMLATFKERFGHLPQFAKVVKAIDALPADLKVAA